MTVMPIMPLIVTTVARISGVISMTGIWVMILNFFRCVFSSLNTRFILAVKTS